ncbi:MAG: glutamine--fructose-6-phosphate transaminase (isomerizing) [Angelakisella sp.]
MCGIVGYSGGKEAAGVLLGALETLEYRGYDSAGISVATTDGIATVKAKGRLKKLEERLCAMPYPLTGHCGIGHTRWATHGEPSDVNSHPHATQQLSLVHNGIIENYRELRHELSAQGREFLSQTDTEVAAQLLDSLYDGDPVAAIRKAAQRLEGSFAFAILFGDHPDEIFAIRRGSPLIVAMGDSECFLASDITAVLPYTNRYALIDEEMVVTIRSGGIMLHHSDGTSAAPQLQTAGWTVEQAQKCGYDHFMLKEIFEQPKALRDTISPRIASGVPSFAAADGIDDSFFGQFDTVTMVACGTAYHAALVGKAAIERLARVPVECDIASEFRYRNPILAGRRLAVIVSQSGETADSLAALRLTKENGCPTLAIVNVLGSSIAREADYVIYTYAGPEIAVASTKAYSVQLAALYLIAIRMGLSTKILAQNEAIRLTKELVDSIAAVGLLLERSEDFPPLAAQYTHVSNAFFMGRGLDCAVAMEGSLKLKEISYIHSEAYPAGELKHGTISLITQGVPVVALITQVDLLPKTVSNIREVHSRGAQVLLLCGEELEAQLNDTELYAQRILLPRTEELFAPLVAVAAMQLFSYYTAVGRGCDVDKPRNLAKSVTVE